MSVAATGSCNKRSLTQSPRGRRRSERGHGSHFPQWVAAVLLVFALCLLVLSVSGREARAATTGAEGAGDGVVVPLIFPLENRVSFTDTFGAARSGGRTHAGNDLMAPKMTPILAVVGGKLDWLNLTGKLSSYNNQPYYNILLRGDDGNDYFYIHLNNDTPGTDDGQGGVQNAYAPGLTNGTRVQQGQVIGYVGDSGNAEDTGSHLHLELHLGGYVAASSSQSRTPSAIDPYPSLMAAPTLAEWLAAGGQSPTTGPEPLRQRPNRAPQRPPRPPNSATPTRRPRRRSNRSRRPRRPRSRSRRPRPPDPPRQPPSPPAPRCPASPTFKITDWFYTDLTLARNAGVVLPSADQRFRPYSKISRALFAAYLVRAMVPDELAGLTSSGGDGEAGRFSDVDTSYWAYAEIETAARLGLVQGTGDGSTFSPDGLVTRAQMAAMMCRALDGQTLAAATRSLSTVALFKDIPGGYWAKSSIATVEALGLMCGDEEGCFRPLENSTRAQAITVMARLMRLLEGGAGT